MSTLSPNSRQFLAAGTLDFELDHPRVGTRGSNELEGRSGIVTETGSEASGLKVTLAISWSCVISAKMVAAQTGLGALIWFAKDWGNLALVLVGMAGISLTVLVADAMAERIEWLRLPWERHR
jgi:hypothetical protein